MLDILYVCSVMPVKYIYMSYIFSVKIVGFKKQKKRQYKLFAVCHRRQRALCRLPWMTKKPRGSHLCFLRADPFGQFAYSGRRQRLCRPWQTAKNLHIVCFFCFLLNPTICAENIYDIDIFHRHSSHKQVHTSFHT